MIELALEEIKQVHPGISIKVIGVGGAGGNTINRIVDQTLIGIDTIAANTDAQALKLSKADHVIQLGVKSTKGLGTGANPDLGKRAAEEDIEKVMELLNDADIVFLTGGLGGGTGSGALPVIARTLKEKNILCIAIVTKPFSFEGKRRAHVAQSSLELLKKTVDTLIVVPNQKLLEYVDEKMPMIDAFSMINEILLNAVTGISEIISSPGHINVDFADVRTIMKDKGLAVMGTARATGNDRAVKAALQAISSPLLENMDISGASGVLLNITGGPDLALHELSAAAQVIYEKADENANIIVGSVINPNQTDEILVTVIATGFEQATAQAPAPVAETSTTKSAPQPDPFITGAVTQPKVQQPKAPVTRTEPTTPSLESFSLNDLDVPTFMRREVQEQQNNQNEMPQ